MLDVNYIAGLFDGEGTVSLSCRKARGTRTTTSCPRVSLTNCYKPVLEDLIETLGYGRIYLKTKNKLGKLPCYSLELSDRQAYNFICLIEPYTVIKKEQINLVKRFYEETKPMLVGLNKNKSLLEDRTNEKQQMYVECMIKLKEIRKWAY